MPVSFVIEKPLPKPQFRAANVRLRASLSVVAIAIALVAFPDRVSAQGRATARAAGQALVTIVEPLSVAVISDLSFGYLVIGQGQSGTMRVAPEHADTGFGTAVTTGGIRQTCGESAGCMPHPASFRVAGEAGRQYHIALPAQVDAQGSQSGFSLAVTDLQARSKSRPNEDARGLLDNDGRDQFDVGGTLHLPVGTPSDVYRAVITVTVHYS